MLRLFNGHAWLIAWAFLLFAAPAQAQVAFSAKSFGNEVDETPVEGGILIQYALVGQGNPLGEFKATGQYVVHADASLTDGQMTITVTNGDQLFLGFSGTVFANGDFAVLVTVLGGTGQFQAATGSADLWAQDWGMGTFGAAWQGIISY
jgi:hypothetical protein